jgi:NADH-quinone oxidoreductase subunit K
MLAATGIGIGHYLTVGAILFTLGVFGIFLNRKNIIVILMSVELILLAVNINFVAFSAELGDLAGQVFALLILTVAAAEAAIGLAILVIFYRNRGSIAVEDVNHAEGLSRCLSRPSYSFPLLGALIAGLLGRIIGPPHQRVHHHRAAHGRRGAELSCFPASGSPPAAEGAVAAGHAEVIKVTVLRWIHSGSLTLDWALARRHADRVMLVVVTRSRASSTSIRSATWPMIRTARGSSPTCRCSPSPC